VGDPHEDDDRIARQSAAEASAAGLGLIVGSATGGPIGVIMGAALGPPLVRVFRRLEAELGSRVLGRRQAARIGTAWRVALEQIAERLERGERPRAEYLDDGPDDSSDADELLEEATRIAAESADERKAALLGRGYASILFSHEITPADARYFCRLVERLTYRQLVAVAVVAEAGDFDSDPFMQRYHKIIDAGDHLQLDPAVALELDDLANAHMIGIVERPEKRKNWIGHEAKVNHPFTLWGDDTPDPIWMRSIGRVRATPMARQLAELYADGISGDERQSWVTDAWRVIPREPLPPDAS